MNTQEEARLLIDQEDPLCKEVAEMHNVNFHDVREESWFVDAVADSLEQQPFDPLEDAAMYFDEEYNDDFDDLSNYADYNSEW